MAALTSEAMLYGNWKNFTELEDSINLHELNAFLAAAREREQERNKFSAAIAGINLDANDDKETPAERVEKMKQRIAAQQAGKSPEQMEYEEDFMLDFETE